MKVSRTLRAYAKQHALRLVAFAFETQEGSTVELDGCVTIDDSARLAEMLCEIYEMCDRAEREAAEKARD